MPSKKLKPRRQAGRASKSSQQRRDLQAFDEVEALQRVRKLEGELARDVSGRLWRLLANAYEVNARQRRMLDEAGIHLDEDGFPFQVNLRTSSGSFRMPWRKDR